MANGHGGARPNSGPKTGLVRQKAEERLRAGIAATTQFLPDIHPIIQQMPALQIMQICMREALQRGDFEAASRMAKEVAPYEQPRLSAIHVKAPDQIVDVKVASTAELDAMLATIIDSRDIEKS